MKLLSVVFLLFMMVAIPAHAGELREAYIDKIGNVHVVGADGEDLAITDDGLARHVRMAPNGNFVVWLVRDYTPRDGYPRDDASMFGAYDGTITGFVDCELPIRRLWFLNGGENIGIECGRKGAAGFELLYDAATLEIVDSFDESKAPAKKRPQWSRMSMPGRN